VVVGTASGCERARVLHYDSPHEVWPSAPRRRSSPATSTRPGRSCAGRTGQGLSPDEYRTFVAVSDIQAQPGQAAFVRRGQDRWFRLRLLCQQPSVRLPDVEIGENTFVHENAALEFMVRVGDNVLIGAGTCIGHSSVMEDDSYAGRTSRSAETQRWAAGRSSVPTVASLIVSRSPRTASWSRHGCPERHRAPSGLCRQSGPAHRT